MLYRINEKGLVTNPTLTTVSLDDEIDTYVQVSTGKKADGWYYGIEIAYHISNTPAGCSVPCGSSTFAPRTSQFDARQAGFEAITRHLSAHGEHEVVIKLLHRIRIFHHREAAAASLTR
jgi:hypothetical protein